MKRKFTFKRWIAHWKAFNKLAIDLGIWKVKYITHDIEKPILNLMLSDKLITKVHRKYNRHHIRDGKIRDLDGAIIDFECARFTKPEKPMPADLTVKRYYDNNEITEETYGKFKDRLMELDLWSLG